MSQLRKLSFLTPLLGQALLGLMALPRPRGDSAPKDIAGLVTYLENRGDFNRNANNLLSAWGPQSRPLISAQFLPPRLVQLNENTVADLRFRTVAAQDIARNAPAPLLDGGEMVGSIRYKLGDSALARQLTPADYDAVMVYLNRTMTMPAAARLLGIFDTLIVQSMTEHDELASCDAIVSGGYSRRGNNGYFEYINGPELDNHRVVMAEDWSDPTVNPWVYILARIEVLTDAGYELSGIRSILTNEVRTILKENPFTALRVGKANLVLNSDGTIRAQSIPGVITDDELDAAFTGLKVQTPLTQDLRIATRTGQKRAFQEGALAFIASTGQTEQVIYNQDDPKAVPLEVADTIGFTGIGKAAGQGTPGRRTATRVFANQSDARVEFEGWQCTGPVINQPQAISVATGIQ